MRRRRPQKMGFEGAGARRAEPYTSADRLRVGGVDFTYSKLAGWVCTMCSLGTGLRDMQRHAQGHATAVARRDALARITRALEQLGADELGAVADILPAVVANLAGFGVVARALTTGERKHPGRGLGPSADQPVIDHLGALERHGRRSAVEWPGGGVVVPAGEEPHEVELAIDADTGLPHAGLAAARGVLAVQRAEERRR